MEDRYTYSVKVREHAMIVTAGLWDPQRWAASVERGERKDAGGMAFGVTAELHVRDDSWDLSINAPVFQVEVTQGSIGTTDLAVGRQRAEVMRQVLEMGDLVQELIDQGHDLADIGRWFFAALSGPPTSTPFRYDAKRVSLAAEQIKYEARWS